MIENDYVALKYCISAACFFLKEIEMIEAHWKIGKQIFLKKWEITDLKVFRSFNKVSFVALEKNVSLNAIKITNN